MVSAAQEHEVVEFRFAAVDPVPDVVGLRPLWRSVAAWKTAAAVTMNQRSSQAYRDRSPGAADIECGPAISGADF